MITMQTKQRHGLFREERAAHPLMENYTSESIRDTTRQKQTSSEKKILSIQTFFKVSNGKLTVLANFTLDPMSSATCGGSNGGGMYFDSDDNTFYGCNTTHWVPLS